MIKKHSSGILTIGAIFLFLSWIVLLAYVLNQPFDFKAICSFNDIEYVDVTKKGHTTCDFDFTLDNKAEFGFKPEYCPMPKNAECNVEGNIPMLFFSKT